MSNLMLFLVVALPRTIYIWLTDQTAGDTPLYLRVSENILRGCGFSASVDPVNCEPIVGGYFPAYPYLLAALQFIGLTEKGIALFIGACFALSILYLRKALELTTQNSEMSLGIALLVGLSPLTLGWSRFLLMEPVMTIFSVLLLARFMMLWHTRKMRDVWIATVILAIATYFKPTSVLFVAPFTITLVYVFGVKQCLKPIVFSALSLAIAILPWELRNQSLSGQSVFNAQSTIWPSSKSYGAWVHSWSITEYERAYAIFPIFAGNLQKIEIKENPFLSREEADHAVALIQEHSLDHTKWNHSIDEKFEELLELKKSSTSLLSLLRLRASQMVSLVLHPANSWAFPISLNAKKGIQHDLNILGYSVDANVLSLMLAKGLLFLYRLALLGLLGLLIYKLIRGFIAPRLSPKDVQRQNRFQLVNDNFLRFLFIASSSLLVATLVLFVLLLSGLEHRYLSPVMLWLEVTVAYWILSARAKTKQ